MKAAYLEEAGGPEKIRIGDLPDPEPGPGQVLIRNRAAGVGPWDWKMMAGMWMELSFPYVPGFEGAGVIERAPEGSSFKPGDEVFASVRGGWAELAVADADKVAPRPAKLTFEEAAGLVIPGGTAYEGLVDRLQVGPGDTVLVTAASGGVGSIAVQVAVAQGARVIGLASAANQDFVRGLGASDAFDYNQPGWAERVREAAGGGVDALFEGAGGPTGEEAMTALKDGGRAVSIAFPAPDYEAAGRGLTGEVFSAVATRERLEAVGRLADEGRLRVEIAEAMPLDRAADAAARSKAGHTRGKIVLVP